MGNFKKYRNSNFLVFHDLPQQGAVGTIVNASIDMRENFRTGQPEEKVTLYFQEWKPMTLTNVNLDTLDKCFPTHDLETIAGCRIWVSPVEVEVGGELKQVVRIDELQTLRMQPDPSQAGAGGPGPMATPSDVPPTPVHDELNPPPPTDDDAEFFKNDPGF